VKARAKRSLHGFMLMELAIGLLIMGGLLALMIPLWKAISETEYARKDGLQVQQASDALMRQALVGHGLPAPLAFAEMSFDTGTASSHRDVDPLLVPLLPGWPGALPGALLGVSTVSPLQTAYWYDVQPALRADSDTGFYPLASQVDGVWAFESILEQFDPDINTSLGTGGNRGQLCRNLNSLQAIDQSIRSYTPGSATVYRRDHINITLPRVWATGYESRFVWNRALGYASFTAVGGQDQLDAAFENSTAAAFVVVRRQPAALRRLDRQNAVYAQAGLSGLDPALAARGYDDGSPPVSYPAFEAERGFRIYEHPNAVAFDDPASDERDYAGLVRSVTLGEFAAGLRQAGFCTAPGETCKANQLFVRFSNFVRSQPPSGSTERLTMRWSLRDWESVEADPPLVTGDVSGASISDGICLDAFSTDVASEARHRKLRIAFLSPSGTVKTYLDGLFVSPTGGASLPTSDNGITVWLNLESLKAAKAAQTVTIGCTGAYAVSAEGAAGEIVDTGAKPNCTVTQQP
jgi:type II secretory pathway pseudopilin PulG